jgi:chromosome segregation ATPase
LQKQYNTAQITNQQLQERINLVRAARLAEFNTSMEKLVTEQKAIENNIATLTANKTKLESDIVIQKKKIADLTTIVNNNTAQVAAAADADARRASLSQQIASIQSQISNLTSRATQLQNSINTLQARMRTPAGWATIIRDQADLRSMVADAATVAAQLLKLRSDISTLQTQLNNVQSVSVKSPDAIATDKANLDAAQKQLTVLESSLTPIGPQITAEQAKLADVKKRIDALNLLKPERFSIPTRMTYYNPSSLYEGYTSLKVSHSGPAHSHIKNLGHSIKKPNK